MPIVRGGGRPLRSDWPLNTLFFWTPSLRKTGRNKIITRKYFKKDQYNLRWKQYLKRRMKKVHCHLLRPKYSLEISSLLSEPPQSILPCQMRQNTRNLKKMCNLIQSDIYISMNAGSIWGGGVGRENFACISFHLSWIRHSFYFPMWNMK